MIGAVLSASSVSCRADDPPAALLSSSLPAPTAARTTTEAPAATSDPTAPPAAAASAGPQPARSASAILPGTCTVTGKATPLHAPPLDLDAKAVSRQNLQAWIAALADCKTLEGRDSGSDEARGLAKLLAKKLQSFGIAGGASMSRGEYCQEFQARGKPDENVVARLSRNAGRANAPVVILGAHYDHLGREGGICHPGADDNASGVAALLEVARVLGRGGGPSGCDVVFVFFGGEERGLLGSEHYALNPTVPWSDVKLMVNLDMVGRQLLQNGLPPSESGAPFGADTIAYVFRDPATAAAVSQAGASAGVQLQGVKKSLLLRFAGDYASDDDSFVGHTTTVFLSTSIHLDYHQPTDTAAKIDVAQVERAAKVTLELVK